MGRNARKVREAFGTPEGLRSLPGSNVNRNGCVGQPKGSGPFYPSFSIPSQSSVTPGPSHFDRRRLPSPAPGYRGAERQERWTGPDTRCSTGRHMRVRRGPEHGRTRARFIARMADVDHGRARHGLRSGHAGTAFRFAA